MFLAHNEEIFSKHAISDLKSILLELYEARTTLGPAMHTGFQFSLSSALHRKKEEPNYLVGTVCSIPKAYVSFREPGQYFKIRRKKNTM